MTKKYVNYRISLLVALLILNTLSSCVNRQQRLNIFPTTKCYTLKDNMGKTNFKSCAAYVMGTAITLATLVTSTILTVRGLEHVLAARNTTTLNRNTSMLTTLLPTQFSSTVESVRPSTSSLELFNRTFISASTNDLFNDTNSTLTTSPAFFNTTQSNATSSTPMVQPIDLGSSTEAFSTSEPNTITTMPIFTPIDLDSTTETSIPYPLLIPDEEGFPAGAL